MPADMTHALKSIHDYLVHGTPVPITAGKEWPVESFVHELERDLPRGTSANHRLLWAVCGMLRGEERAIQYLHRRIRHELDHAMGLTEAFSPTYWALHRYLWMVVSYRGPAELRDLAREWLARDAAVSAVCSVLQDGKIRTYAPGQRDDQARRRTEEELLGLMLGLPHERVETDSYWQWVVKGARHMERHIPPAPWVTYDAASRIAIKYRFPGIKALRSTLARVRLMSPIHYMAWGPQTWAAWTPRCTHPQDPPLLGVVYDEGEVRRLHPFPDGGNPPEEGWSGEAWQGASYLQASYWRKGKHYVDVSISLPPGRPSVELTIGEQPSQPAPPPDPVDPPEGIDWSIPGHLLDARGHRLRARAHIEAALAGQADTDHDLHAETHCREARRKR